MSLVSIYTRNEYLYLRWSYQGKQYRLATKLFDTPENRKAIQGKVKLIESDIAYERLDTTLAKYGKRGIREERKLIPTYTIRHLWDKFYAFKQMQLQEQTLTKYLILEKSLIFFGNLIPKEISRSKARDFMRLLREKCETRSGNLRTVKEQIGYLSAMWKWGQSEGLIEPSLGNPFSGLASEIKPRPKQPPKPFTKEEIGKIVDWFVKRNSHYSFYVQFLFSTGVRIGEAIGLQWKHIDWEKKTIWIGESLTRGLRKSTKTGKARIIPMSEKLEQILRLQARECNLICAWDGQTTFTSPNGKSIDDHNFNHRVWRKCLYECEIPYRRPYNCRHTFISHCLESGMSPATVATITGHNVKTLYENYAGSVISKPVLPELF